MFQDFFTYSAEALALAANGTQVLTVQVDTDADFAIVQHVATAIDRRVRLTMQETSTGRQLHDLFPLPLLNLFGDGRHPYRLPVAKLLDRGTSLTIVLTDESGAPNQVRLAFHGLKLLSAAPWAVNTYRFKELFTYGVPFLAAAVDPTGLGVIPAGGTGQYNVRIQPDADFEWDKLSATYDLAIPAAQDTIATLEIRDESLGRRFMDRPIPVESFSAARFGDPLGPSGFYPYVLPKPKTFRAGSLVSLIVRNQDPANALSIRFSLTGKKCYL
jgi:hypothetical protein